MLNTGSHLPVLLDCTDPVALEAGLKRLAGRSVVNSINLEDGGRKAGKILDLCRRHGAAVVGMCIDQRGMAATAGRKAQVADRLVALAKARGLQEGDLFIDPLTFTLGSGDRSLARAGRETLSALAAIKKRHPGCHTILGVSNISYGLPAPARKCLNAVFLDEALKRGLDAAILHAGKITPLTAIQTATASRCRDLIFDRRRGGRQPLAALLGLFEQEPPQRKDREAGTARPEDRVLAQVVNGDAAGLAETVGELLQKYSAIVILDRFLLPAMGRVGRLFGQGRLQLPFVLRSAEAMQQAARVLGPRLKRSASHRGTMILATVRGDIHDIGKDLVDMILTANGYRVINLGVRQSAEDILAAAARHRPDAIGLSGLLVESVRAMREYLEVFEQAGLTVPVVCGGAALQEGYLKRQMRPVYSGQVHYARDAMDGLRVMNAICRKRVARRR
jgi:5-methyltetrahydrofolate--homocysteine methyltransferase